MTPCPPLLFRTLICTVALSVLAACASKPPQRPPIDLASATRIGVHSRCGTHITREAFALFPGIGLDEITARPVPDWKLDQLIVSALRVGLARASEPVDIEIAQELKQAALVSDFAEIAARMPIAVATARPKADILVIVLPSRFGAIDMGAEDGFRPQVANANALTGFGVFSHGPDRTIHVVCSAFIFDTRRNLIAHHLQAVATSPLPQEAVADRWERYSEQQLALARLQFTTFAMQVGSGIGRDVVKKSNAATGDERP